MCKVKAEPDNIKTRGRAVISILYNTVKNEFTEDIKKYIKGQMCLSFHIPVSNTIFYSRYIEFCVWLKLRNKKARIPKHIRFNSTLKAITNDIDGQKHKFIVRSQIFPVYPELYRVSKYGWVYIKADSSFLNRDISDNVINVLFIGKDAYANMHDCIQHMYKNMRKKANKDIKRVRICELKKNIETSFYIEGKKDGDIIWSGLDDLKKYISAWRKLKDLYVDRHIPHKLSILLYGKPGTGKSSVINYIAGYTKRSIVYMKPNTSMDSLTDFLEEPSSIKKYILVFEDIDLFFLDTAGITEDKVIATSKEEKLHYLLQLFSGINTPNDMMIICTTNYIEKLDERLTRPGRFDLVYKMPEFGPLEARQMCQYYNVPARVVLQGMGDYINPAELQNLCIKYAMQENIRAIKEDLS